MRTITEINVSIFLDKHKNKLLNKTDYYNKYFLDWEVDTNTIIDLSNNDLYELEKVLEWEKSYLHY